MGRGASEPEWIGGSFGRSVEGFHRRTAPPGTHGPIAIIDPTGSNRKEPYGGKT